MDALRKLSSLGRNQDKILDTASSSSYTEASVAEIPKASVETGGKDEASPSGLAPIKVRVSNDVGAEIEEKRGGDEESVGSGESFDSALERLAASSVTSFEPPSPVGSVGEQSQFAGGVSEDLEERGQEEYLYYDDYGDDGEVEKDGSEKDSTSSSSSSSSSECSSSASNTEDEMDISEYGASSERAMPLANPSGVTDEEEEDGKEEETGIEEKFEEVYDGGVDSPLEEIDVASAGNVTAREFRDEPEAWVSSRDSTEDSGKFIVTVSVTELKYNVERAVTAEENMPNGLKLGSEARGIASSSRGAELGNAFKDSREDHEVQEELTERSVKVAVENYDQEGEDADSTEIKKEFPRELTQSRTVIESPAYRFTSEPVDPALLELKSEKAQPNTQSFARIAEGESDADADADADDEDVESGDEHEDGYTEINIRQAAGKSESENESGNNPSLGPAGPSLISVLVRKTARRPASTAATDTQSSNAASSTQVAGTTDVNPSIEVNEVNETREKLQNIRVKFLRLVHRLGQSPQNVVVAQVLYRLGLAESLRGGSTRNHTRAFDFDRANAIAEEQEADNQEEELDFACTILVLGKTGVGKSATINSIFDEHKSVTNAYNPSTTNVYEVVGTMLGVKVRFVDTPGLLFSVADQRHNERIMGRVKKYIKKASPDIVLYFDRMDMQTREFGDVPLLRTITNVFGTAVWFNTIVVLTHASTAPPDGPNGTPMGYELFVAQRSHSVQQSIRQVAGDMRLQNPVSLVENHPACRANRNGQRVLPNGQIWKPHLMLLCFASKILAEANTLLKLQDTAAPGRPFGQRSRVPPLPFLLSSLLQSRAQLKLPDEQLDESDESDDDEEDEEEGDEYDDLPPFRSLSKEELEELSKDQRQEYAEELAVRERLFQKKQHREQLQRRKEMKKRATAMRKEGLSHPADEADDEAGQPAAVPVPMPDMALPPSFDSDNPTHRYRYLETANQWLVRPVLETHGWDHDAGYDGFNVEKMFVVKNKIPASISGQVTKDKKESQVNFEAAASLKHGEGKVTLTGFDVQTIGKDLAYTLRAETRFNNFKRNKTTAGVTATYLNDTIAAGVKLEDRILIGKRVKMVVNGGVLTGKGDKAFGGSLEATLRGKEYPLSRTLSTLGLSVMDWHGDLAIGGNLQSQFMVGKTMMVGRANLNNRGSGQVSIRASSSEQLQMVLIGIVPILRSLINCRFGFGGGQSSQ
ncbi:translocase of chloroplast 126, chloroplastic-like isoform X2 [Physcomitrium patens]|uniref:AIG1-type G domain-containing protein n=1 Tax=Physcomitrium patens TaxID=3218 RepID=A0A2K1JVD5_PHYPA|nr:translocase of chloroplast 120, chloroplastic-like [Physcomitrium patens]XP_024389086.1 translocase of chloroplast 120, chloroplastic-like [Physcomitrium patens]PNR45487.1 hypothetical protein PHYPA_015258 [Physcomitrium patens]|eukprot:XP_024389085.1 translocase of chloroplast 120, chloroplastic-like [Physcomitrella patens]